MEKRTSGERRRHLHGNSGKARKVRAGLAIPGKLQFFSFSPRIRKAKAGQFAAGRRRISLSFVEKWVWYRKGKPPNRRVLVAASSCIQATGPTFWFRHF